MSRHTLLFGSVVVAAGAVIAWLSAPSAVAQFGGGGFGGGLGGDVFEQPQSHAGEQIIQGGGMEADLPSFFILTSPDKSRVWGYSTAKGEWKDSGFREDGQGDIAPVVSRSVAVFSTRDKAYAFGSETGEWSKVDMSGPGTPIVGMHVATIRDGRKVHAFSGLKGEWSTLELPEGTELGDQQPVVGTDYVQVHTPTSVSIFSARTGNWSTVKFAEK